MKMRNGLRRWLAGWAGLAVGWLSAATGAAAAAAPSPYQFDGPMPRVVLERYLARAISTEGVLNGRGDFPDNLRMLRATGAKFIGRSLCLWAGEANLPANLERARQLIPQVHAADPEMILQACIFEIVTAQVNQVPVPAWALTALGQPVETRNFRYEDMLYADGRRRNHWGPNASVPDVSRPETQLWFYFLAASYIDIGIEAIHYGQVELMNGNDRDLRQWAGVFARARAHAGEKARRHWLLCDAHVPGGGLQREGRLLLDFHSFPLRIKEAPPEPLRAILEVGFSDSLFRRSKGGTTPAGWSCEHLPYLVELDNWGGSKTPGQAGAGGIWVWGYDEITWFAHLDAARRRDWLAYAAPWVRRTDPAGHLQMPGSRTLSSRLDGKHWYHANQPGPAVPDGFGDEDAIRAAWVAADKVD